MAWVVDTCVLLDIALGDAVYGKRSAKALSARLRSGLVVCPASVVEMTPAFGGNLSEVRFFLRESGITADETWQPADTDAAALAWNIYVNLKRLGESPNRPVADLLIGGFASRHQGLITRNPKDFRPYFPGMTLIEP